MIIVNLFGVPGAGKSTGAAYIFSQLKMKGINAELITEFAKDKVWENNEKVFKNQLYLFGKQSFRISRVQDEVDVIVTDSPLLLSILYNQTPILGENFNQLVYDVFNSYNNINYLIHRIKSYNPSGRMQTEEESNALAQPMVDLLTNWNVPYSNISGDIDGYNQIVSEVLQLVNKEKK